MTNSRRLSLRKNWKFETLMTNTFLPRAARPARCPSAAHRQPPEPKNTFTSASTRYLKTPYCKKTEFFHTAYPKGRDTLFPQLVIPQPLKVMPKRPKPSRLTQNYPTLEPDMAHWMSLKQYSPWGMKQFGVRPPPWPNSMPCLQFDYP
jgi:hypothetical protein